ncbi:YwqI/YxiC family protein [Peribacillus sp. B-H-3]|uniref:YwqI/YxiC family protein n=1 Tax=Peribacillus sp. B-H-3 TaxID=3400420 RepID=UPI003B011378
MEMEIKLKHDAVISQLSKTKTALEALTLKTPAENAAGSNKLDFTSHWLEREGNLAELLKSYMAIVQKNIEDTKAGVDLMKHQDEAMIRK